MTAITNDAPGMFWTKAYGAFRWDKHLYSSKAPWYLVTLNIGFDHFRGVESPNIPCTTDDFGNLVRVSA